MKDINAYLRSGTLEAYVLGIASEDETAQLMALKKEHPEINTALADLEADMERLAQHMAVPPPPHIFERINDDINALIKAPNPVELVKPQRAEQKAESAPQSPYIDVVADSTHMQIHKAWRWAFAGVFVLGKIFLAFAIYYYLENRQAQVQIDELKTELRQFKNR